jgi:hypothetical protein
VQSPDVSKKRDHSFFLRNKERSKLTHVGGDRSFPFQQGCRQYLTNHRVVRTMVFKASPRRRLGDAEASERPGRARRRAHFGLLS